MGNAQRQAAAAARSDDQSPHSQTCGSQREMQAFPDMF